MAPDSAADLVMDLVVDSATYLAPDSASDSIPGQVLYLGTDFDTDPVMYTPTYFTALVDHLVCDLIWLHVLIPDLLI